MTQNRNQKREKWVGEFGNCIMGNELKDKVNSVFFLKKKGGSSNFEVMCFQGNGAKMFEKVLSGAKSHHFSPKGC